MLALRLLSNIFNLFSQKLHHSPSAAFLVFYIVLWLRAAIRKQSKRRSRLQAIEACKPYASAACKFKDAPCIAFSGAGLLFMYYQGTCAYLRDNFELQNVTYSGISMGAHTATCMAWQLSTQQSILFALKWSLPMFGRRIGPYFVRSDHCKAGEIAAQHVGIDDDAVREHYNHISDLYIGCTKLPFFTHESMAAKFEDVHEAIYAITCSMRIFPFYCVPGLYKRKCLIDGGFSACFSIPSHVNRERVIKITPSTRITADIQPRSADSFTIIDAYKPPTLKQICAQFAKGYSDAMRSRPQLIRKGLTPNSEACNQLGAHLEFVKYAYQSVKEEDKEGTDSSVVYLPSPALSSRSVDSKKY